jgi:hypothetical protein
MVDAGDAQAIMGNHEFNAIAYGTPDGKGGHLRPHVEKNIHQHGYTLDQFTNHQDEWTEWLNWFKALPMFLDLGALRAVHACWDAERIPLLSGHDLMEEAFLQACVTRKAPEYRAIENVLKGPELFLPPSVLFTDKEGVARPTIRTRWWQNTVGMTMGELVMPLPMEINHPIKARHLKTIPNYPADAPPVFFGHYWMPPDAPRVPLTPNIACLDYSGAFGTNPLVAYRWDGEQELTADKFITTNPIKPQP